MSDERPQIPNVFQQGFAATPCGVVITDAQQEDNPIIYCNRSFERMTGYKAEEILGRNCRFLQNDDRDQEGVSDIRAAIEAGREVRTKIRNYRKDGMMFWNELVISPIYDDDGRIANFIGIQTDRTAIQLAEDQLDEFFNLSLNLLCIADTNGFFRKLNPSFERILGYSPEELMAKPILDFVHEDDREVTLAEMEQLRSGSNTIDFQNRYYCKDGSLRWFEWSCPAPKPGSQLLYAIARDVTRQKEAEQAITTRLNASQAEEVYARLETLSPREAEVMNLVISGMSSKQIALSLNRSEKTIEKHRANVMRKMQTASIADLVRTVTAAGYQI